MRAFVVTVPVGDVDVAADRLFQIGVAAVEERDAGSDGSVELWTEVGDAEDSIRRAGEVLDASWRWRSVELDEEATNTWREHAAPSWITDDVVVVPSWLERPSDADAALSIRIDPGAAFGLGDHPTTILTMRALLDELARRNSGVRVLDVGCGSGVLAIAAAMRGAERVVAIDISAAAIEATERNVATNGVAGIVDASTTPLAELDETFDVVLANVLAPAIIAMAGDLRRVLAPGGVLVISGVLADRHAHVVAALAPMSPTGTATRDGWAAVSLRH